MARALKIEETIEGGAHVLAIKGRVDTNTSPQLDSHASRIFLAEGAPAVVMDLAACDFVSSAGLRVIITLQKRAARGGSLVFRNVPPTVMEVFQHSGFDRVLTIE